MTDNTYKSEPWLPEQDNQLRKCIGKLQEEVGELQLATLEFVNEDKSRDWLDELADVLALIELNFEVCVTRHCHAHNVVFTPYFQNPDSSVLETHPEDAWHNFNKSLATTVMVIGRLSIHGANGIDPKLGCINVIRYADVINNLYRNIMAIIANLEYEDFEESEIIPTRVIQKKASILPWLMETETNFTHYHPFLSSETYGKMRRIEFERKSDWMPVGSKTEADVICGLLDDLKNK